MSIDFTLNVRTTTHRCYGRAHVFNGKRVEWLLSVPKDLQLAPADAAGIAEQMLGALFREIGLQK